MQVYQWWQIQEVTTFSLDNRKRREHFRVLNHLWLDRGFNIIIMPLHSLLWAAGNWLPLWTSMAVKSRLGVSCGYLHKHRSCDRMVFLDVGGWWIRFVVPLPHWLHRRERAWWCIDNIKCNTSASFPLCNPLRLRILHYMQEEINSCIVNDNTSNSAAYWSLPNAPRIWLSTYEVQRQAGIEMRQTKWKLCVTCSVLLCTLIILCANTFIHYRARHSIML